MTKYIGKTGPKNHTINVDGNALHHNRKPNSCNSTLEKHYRAPLATEKKLDQTRKRLRSNKIIKGLQTAN